MVTWLSPMRMGVVIWPKERIDALLGKADVKRQQDNARLARLQQDTHKEPDLGYLKLK